MQEDFAITVAGPKEVPPPVPDSAPEAAAKPPPSVPASEPVAAVKQATPLPRFLGNPMPKPVEDLDATIMLLDPAIAGIIPPGHVDVEAEASTVPNSPETSSSLGSLRLSDSDEEARQGSQSGVPEEEAAAQNLVSR